MFNAISHSHIFFSFRIAVYAVCILLTNSVLAQAEKHPYSVQQNSAYAIITNGDTLFISSRSDQPECNKVFPHEYPKLFPDDYLHEERFDGLKHVIIFDHLGTRKILNIFLPSIDNPDADLCGVKIIITNPHTGQVAVFYDVFNWINRNGQQIFNMNKELHDLWGFKDTKESFQIKLVHVPTGLDYSFKHADITLNFKGL